jgi:hypothetical protein
VHLPLLLVGADPHRRSHPLGQGVVRGEAGVPCLPARLGIPRPLLGADVLLYLRLPEVPAAPLVAAVARVRQPGGMRVNVTVNGQLHRMTLPAGQTARQVVDTLCGHWRQGQGPATPHALFTAGGIEVEPGTVLGDLPELGELVLRPRVVH